MLPLGCSNGIVDSWEDMELIWGHSFQASMGPLALCSWPFLWSTATWQPAPAAELR